MRAICLLLAALACLGCGRTVTAPEVSLEAIAKYCVAVDSVPLATRYECRVPFKPSPSVAP